MAKQINRGLIGKEDLSLGSGTFTRATSIGGTQTLTQVNTNPNNIVMADQMSGADNSAKIQAAVGLLPSTGGYVDARGLPNETTGGSTTIDFGTVPTTLLLPPVNVCIKQVLMRNGCRILGSGKGPSTLTSVSTTLDAFVMDATQTVQNLVLSDFQLFASANSAATQNGIHFSITNPSQGLWYSFFTSVLVVGFGGNQWFMDGQGGGLDGRGGLGVHQFNTFINCVGFRKDAAAWVNGTSYAVGQTVTISAGQITTYAGGTAYTPGQMVINSGTPDTIYVCIANTTGHTPPSSTFWNVLTQYAAAATYVCTSATSSAVPGSTTGASHWATYDSCALQLLGANGQNTFIGCQFDGDFGGNNSGVNIRITATSNIGDNFTLPYSNKFIKQTTQFSALAVYCTGAVTTHFDSPHFERNYGGVLLDYNATVGAGISGFIVSDGHWLTSSGVNGGAGYLAALTSNTTNPGSFGNEFGDLTFTGNNVFGFAGVPSASIPDNVVLASGGSNQTISYGNTSAANGSTIGPYSFIPTIAATTAPNIGRAKVINITSGSGISTFATTLSPGEQFVLNCTSGPVVINGGSGISNSLVLETGDAATFTVLDGANGFAVSGTSKPGLVASVSLTGLSASVATAGLFTTASAGMYRISASIVTTIGSGSATVTAQIQNTNDGTNSLVAPLTTTGQLSTLGFEAIGSATVYCTAGSTIDYAAPVVGSVGSARFSLRFRVEYLG